MTGQPTQPTAIRDALLLAWVRQVEAGMIPANPEAAPAYQRILSVLNGEPRRDVDLADLARELYEALKAEHMGHPLLARYEREVSE